MIPCKKCGDCCKVFEIFLRGNDPSVADARNCIIANFKKLGIETVDPVIKFRLEGACIHLDKDNKCKIYDSRPDRCRAYSCPFMENDGKSLNNPMHKT